jgi:dihydroorotate dehydrogenase
VRAQLEQDFERFKRGLPRDFAAHVRAAYRIDLAGRYAGEPLPHPIGKGSGQLSLNAGQLEEDAAAGLAFVVLKTVIAEDAAGARAMAAWAIHETRMRVERRAASDGRLGWTVTWKGRGWDRTLDEYLALVRAGRDVTRAGGPLVVPSVKYHLPRLDEPFRDGEYRHTTERLAQAWGSPPLVVEKDFSPTLAGDALADDRAQILRWLREVPGRIRAASPISVRVAVKLMNARFDDAFQVDMMNAAADADALVCFNRLFDAERGVAYGGWDLSERNLRVLGSPGLRPGSVGSLTPHASAGIPELSGTGNVHSGRMILEYARRGCASVQLHTFFQLPLSEYPATEGSRTQRALHALVFAPGDGLIAAMLELEARGEIERRGGELHFLDVGAHAHRAS